MPGISNNYPFFLFPPPSPSLFPFVPAKRHSFASHSDISDSPSLSSDTVLRRRNRRRRLSIVTQRDKLQIDIYSNYRDAQRRSLRLRRVSFRLSSALCRLVTPSLPFFLPSSFCVSSRRRRIIAREPEFHFALIERSAAPVSVVRRTTNLP